MSVLLSPELTAFLSAAFHTNDLVALLNKASAILKNPIAVFDTNYSTVAYSDTSKVNDNDWLGGEKRGYCLYEYAALLHKSGMDIYDSTTYTILDNFGSRRRRICPLIYNDKPIGYMSVLEYDTVFPAVPDEYYHLVQGVMSKELVVASAVRVDTWHRSEEAILTDLINRPFANRALYQQRIKDTVFEKSMTYQVVCIDMKDFTPKEQHLKTFKDQLLDIFPCGWSVYIKRYAILLIASQNEKESLPLKPGNSKKLQALLDDYRVKAAVSDPFSDLYFVRQFYDEAVCALSLATEFGHLETLAWYDRYKLLRAVSQIPPDKKSLYYTMLIQRLMKSDEEKGTEYIATLMAYLETDRSLEATGKRLSVHRNTVAYRIGRIKDLYGVDFSNSYDNFQNYFGCLLIMSMRQ